MSSGAAAPRDVLLGPLDSLQLHTHVRYLHVFPFTPVCTSDSDDAVLRVFDDVASQLTKAWRDTIVDSFPVLTGHLAPDATRQRDLLRVHDVDPRKVDARVPMTVEDQRASVGLSSADLRRGHWTPYVSVLSSRVLPRLLTNFRVSLCHLDGDSHAIAVAFGVNHRIGDAASTARLAHHFAARFRAAHGAFVAETLRVGPRGSLSGHSVHFLEPPTFERPRCPAFTANESDAPVAGEVAGSLNIEQMDGAATPVAASDGGASSQNVAVADAARVLLTLRFMNADEQTTDARAAVPGSTRNDAVVAAALAAVSRARLAAGAPPTERATCIIVVDIRGERAPPEYPLPVNFFGNGLVLACVDGGTVAEAADPARFVDLLAAAHTQIRAVANDKTDIARRVEASLSNSFGFDIPDGMFVLSSWVPGDPYALDFGWGRPLASTSVQSPLIPQVAFLVPTPPDVGRGIDAPLTLSGDVARALLGGPDAALVSGIAGAE